MIVQKQNPTYFINYTSSLSSSVVTIYIMYAYEHNDAEISRRGVIEKNKNIQRYYYSRICIFVCIRRLNFIRVRKIQQYQRIGRFIVVINKTGRVPAPIGHSLTIDFPFPPIPDRFHPPSSQFRSVARWYFILIGRPGKNLHFDVWFTNERDKTDTIVFRPRTRITYNCTISFLLRLITPLTLV